MATTNDPSEDPYASFLNPNSQNTFGQSIDDILKTINFAGGGSSNTDDWMQQLLGNNGTSQDPLAGTGSGWGDMNFDSGGNYTGTDDPFDWSKLQDMFNQSGSDNATSGDGSAWYDKILSAVGGLGSNALNNLGSGKGITDLLGGLMSVYNTNKNTNKQLDWAKELAAMQDPWLGQYQKFQPQMEALWNNRQQDPNYQARNQAVQGLQDLAAQRSGGFKWGN